MQGKQFRVQICIGLPSASPHHKLLSFISEADSVGRSASAEDGHEEALLEIELLQEDLRMKDAKIQEVEGENAALKVDNARLQAQLE